MINFISINYFDYNHFDICFKAELSFDKRADRYNITS